MAAPAGELRWRCRRGMKELDLLLGGWLERDYPGASTAERTAFARLLAMNDPDIFALIQGEPVMDDDELQRLVEHLRHAFAP